MFGRQYIKIQNSLTLLFTDRVSQNVANGTRGGYSPLGFGWGKQLRMVGTFQP